MSTPLFSFTANPTSIPVSTKTSWSTDYASKYTIIPQHSGELKLSHSLSHQPRAYKDAEPFMEKCQPGESILINWYARPTYHYPTWRNFLYEPCIFVTYCYLRKQKDNIFYEYTVNNQEYEKIIRIWKYSAALLPSKKNIIGKDKYTLPRFLIHWSIVFFFALNILRLLF